MEHFTWGVATSAYQIEGGREDGKGDSIWDTFAHSSPTMHDDGDIACDHYHRWHEDVRLMADLGVDAYRFSVAWSRVLPEGTGAVNTKGIAFYDRLVDELLANGITPWLTLYHWDLPQALQDRGGWPNRDTVAAFEEYTAVVADALGDRVVNWITHNEPWVAAMLGHLDGVFAPGMTGWDNALRTAHHLLLSHGRAAPIIRERVPGGRVGITLDCRPARPASDDPADLAAQRHFDGFRNRWFFDPVFGRGYPSDIVETYIARGRIESLEDFVAAGDLETIAAPLDFLGLNYYTSVNIAAGADESEDSLAPGPNPPDGYTEMGWRVTPDALGDFIARLARDYRPASIVITENGASFSDGPTERGIVEDHRRIAYLDAHIDVLTEMAAKGFPVDGYFVWSLIDNLEWAHGFAQRFGLVWVDHATGRRIPKESYHWYRERIRRSRIA